jgi:hypothetical protein
MATALIAIYGSVNREDEIGFYEFMGLSGNLRDRFGTMSRNALWDVIDAMVKPAARMRIEIECGETWTAEEYFEPGIELGAAYRAAILQAIDFIDRRTRGQR